MIVTEQQESRLPRHCIRRGLTGGEQLGAVSAYSDEQCQRILTNKGAILRWPPRAATASATPAKTRTRTALTFLK
jgi:hypothetical protein